MLERSARDVVEDASAGENDRVRIPARKERSGPRLSMVIVLTCYLALALHLTWSWWTPLGCGSPASTDPT